MIDAMLKHLKYLKKQEPEMRKEIYRKAELIQIPSQTMIFKAGDEGDYMYIILKGLVLVEIRR
jgi:CRP-like cAMP-binding protein